MNARPFETTDRVRWADVDLVGIMRFSAVTRFVEMAEQELMRAAGYPYERLMNQPPFWMPRRHLSIDYVSPARIDDPLTMVSYVSRMGDTSLTLNVDLHQANGKLVAAAVMVVVCVASDTFIKQPIPDEFRSVLLPFVCSVEDARASREASRVGSGPR